MCKWKLKMISSPSLPAEGDLKCLRDKISTKEKSARAFTSLTSFHRVFAFSLFLILLSLPKNKNQSVTVSVTCRDINRKKRGSLNLTLQLKVSESVALSCSDAGKHLKGKKVRKSWFDTVPWSFSQEYPLQLGVQILAKTLEKTWSEQVATTWTQRVA